MNVMNYITLIILVQIFFWPLALKGQTVDKPNFVIIMADDLGYGDLSCYWDNSPAKTPNLDEMAKRGIKFSDFHSSGNVCSPTRAGLLTGRYQQRAGIPGVINADPAVPAHHTGLRDQEHTFAELLGNAGYATAIIGKWHLGYKKQFNPVRHGFEKFRGYVSGNIDYISHYDRMETYDWWDNQELIKEQGYVTHLVTQHSVDFIRKNKEKPFCLYVAHEAVHAPWQGPNDPPQRGPEKQPGKQRAKDAALKDMLVELDKGVGEILSAIKEAGIEERTFVLFFSDNGPAGGSAGPLRGRKGSNWEGGHRVPAIAVWPGKIPAGSKSDQLAISLDVMPTILSMANVKTPTGHKLDGVDLTKTLTGEKPSYVRKLYWNSRAMRDGHWKLMLGGRGGGRSTASLYDLSKDIGEQKNVADDFPERVAQMKQQISDWERDVSKSN